MNVERLGLGVMINMLGGNDNAEHVKECLGKTIKTVKQEGNDLELHFEDGSVLEIMDDGQSCCESRYMNTDDDLNYYSDSKFMGAEVKAGPALEVEYDCHDTQFLVITTSKGSFTMVTHNEHNGYYGGFYIRTKLKKVEPK